MSESAALAPRLALADHAALRGGRGGGNRARPPAANPMLTDCGHDPVMAFPRPVRKSSVDLAKPLLRAAPIRRDPPPVLKVLSAHDVMQRDTRNAAIGIVTLALATLVVLAAAINAG
jgi:hypothetical protein